MAETALEIAALFDGFTNQQPATVEVQAAAEERFGELGDHQLEQMYWHGLRRAIEWRNTALRERAVAAEGGAESVTQQTIEGAFATLIVSGAVARTIASRQPDGQDPPLLDTLWREAQRRYGHEDLEHRGQPAIVQFDAFGRNHAAPMPEYNVG